MQTVTRKEKRTTVNSTVANDTTRPKLKQCLVADVHKGERKVQCYTKYAVTTWNIRSVNQGKVEIVKQTMECLNITVFVVSK